MFNGQMQVLFIRKYLFKFNDKYDIDEWVKK